MFVPATRSIVVRLEVVGVQADRGAVILDGAVVVVHLDMAEGSVVESLYLILRTMFNLLRIVVNSLCVKPFLASHIASVRVNDGVKWVQVGCLVKII